MPLCRWAVFALLLAVAAPAWAAQDDTAPAETVPEWPKLNRYATTDQHWSANAYWLESQTGIVLIDALFLRSDVEAMAAAIKSRGKPLAGILLTHPHLDHFGGIAVLRRIFGDVPVYATRATADAVLPAFRRAATPESIEEYGDDFPREAFVPNRIVEAQTPVELGGMSFVFIDLGPMESANNSLIVNTDADLLFTGDATVSGAVYYGGEGSSCRALAGLGMLLAMSAREDRELLAYPGHYSPMRLLVMIKDNIAQLRYLRQLVRSALSDASRRDEEGVLSEEALDAMADEIDARMERYAAYGLTPGQVLRAVLPALAKEIHDENQSGTYCEEDPPGAGQKKAEAKSE